MPDDLDDAAVEYDTHLPPDDVEGDDDAEGEYDNEASDPT